MSKIDLYDPKWVDMVFADKNKAYGAYQLRKSVSQRNIKALVILLVAAFIGGGYLAYQIKKHNDELAAQEELDAMRPELDGEQIMAVLGIGPGPLVGQAYKFLLNLRLDEGELGEEEATRRLLVWWQEHGEP